MGGLEGRNILLLMPDPKGSVDPCRLQEEDFQFCHNDLGEGVPIALDGEKGEFPDIF